MKKTSNKILGALIILSAIIGIAFIIFIKVKGTEEYQRIHDLHVIEKSDV